MQEKLKKCAFTWLVTGVAGFIGSNVLEVLLKLNQFVVGIDNFSTGLKQNLDEVQSRVDTQAWSRFRFIEGDIRVLSDCQLAAKDVDYILHQAALGSVPRSIQNPLPTNAVNIDGFLNMLVAARDAKVRKFIFASSSSVYGDDLSLPKEEQKMGKPMSPYAVSKYVNELYADVFFKVYGLNSIGLRYFNVFGPRQNPRSEYAAVIPKWVSSMLMDEDVYINGLGDNSRDFCYVDNVIQANLLAAMTTSFKAVNQVYNVACHKQTNLLSLYALIKEILAENCIFYHKSPIFQNFRAGDVKHTLASIEKIKQHLGYEPKVDFKENLSKVMPWYLQQFKEKERV